MRAQFYVLVFACDIACSITFVCIVRTVLRADFVLHAPLLCCMRPFVLSATTSFCVPFNERTLMLAYVIL